MVKRIRSSHNQNFDWVSYLLSICRMFRRNFTFSVVLFVATSALFVFKFSSLFKTNSVQLNSAHQNFTAQRRKPAVDFHHEPAILFKEWQVEYKDGKTTKQIDGTSVPPGNATLQIGSDSKEAEYLRFYGAEPSRSGDFKCAASLSSSSCIFQLKTIQKAKRLCNLLGSSCKGFVRTTDGKKHTLVIFKRSFGKTLFFRKKPSSDVFVKKIHVRPNKQAQ